METAVGTLRGLSTTRISGVSNNVTEFLAGRLAVLSVAAETAVSDTEDTESDAESEE